jgi:hypothetical protein
MGIGHTLQQLEGWKGQYNRVLRWQARVLDAVNGKPSADELDFLLAFFQNCLHLRDWLLADGVVDESELQALFQAHIELQICRDLANGFKHHTINRASVDSEFSTLREYIPKNWPSEYAYPNGKWMVLAGGHQLGLVELANRCLSLWQQFLSSKGLL